MGVQSLSIVALVGLLAALVYDRYPSLALFYVNHPSRLVKVNTFQSYEIKFADKIRSCEDVLMIKEQGLAVLACDPGRERWNTVMGVFLDGPVANADLYIYDYKKTNAPDSESLKQLTLANFAGKTDFHTLGLAFDDASSTLLAVNHAKNGSRIEKFHLDVGKLTATHLATIQHPLIRSPNAMIMVDQDTFYLTNDHKFLARDSITLARLETFTAAPLGNVVLVKTHGGEVQATKLASVPFANGIELIGDSTLVVASTTDPGLFFYRVNPDASLTFTSKTRVPFLPDNLSVDGKTLMVAGHPHFPTLARFTKSRHICNDEAEFSKADAAMKEYCHDKSAQAGSWVAEWDAERGLRTLYTDTEYPSSAMATHDSKRKTGIIGGLYAKGILVWRD